MIILGISALYHDSAAALINNNEIIAAAVSVECTPMALILEPSTPAANSNFLFVESALLIVAASNLGASGNIGIVFAAIKALLQDVYT